MDKARTMLLVLLLLLLTSGAVKADVNFIDPHGSFMFTIPNGWIFQAGESSERLLVFYGPEDDQLLYIEYFADLSLDDPWEFGRRVLKHFSAEYGLRDFELIADPELWNLNGIEAAVIEYKYRGSKTRREQRFFVVIEQVGLNISFSDAEASFDHSREEFDLILNSWRWEVDQ
ncbi:MAG: hypothetical protein ACE3NC_07410 [Candidatus Wallacebacter cryptica]|nr:hypothetical protein [Bacillota bacterium]